MTKAMRTIFAVSLLAPVLLDSAPAGSPFGEFSEPDFPFHTCSLDLTAQGKQFPQDNKVPRAIVIKLGNDQHVCWDPDLLRVAGWWEGGFVEMQGMASFSYHPKTSKTKVSPGTKKIPKILGKLRLANGIYPGWSTGKSPLLEDPRTPAPVATEKGLGALPLSIGRWQGLYRAGEKVVLSYQVAGVPIEENFDPHDTSRPNTLCRNFRTLKKTPEALHLAIAALTDAGRPEYDEDKNLTIVPSATDLTQVTAFGIISPTKSIKVNSPDNKHFFLTIPKGTPPTLIKLVIWQGIEENLQALGYLSNNTIPTPNPKQGGPPLWPETEVTRLPKAWEPTQAELETCIRADKLPLPLPNKWKRNFRPASITSWGKKDQAVVTFDGDVWLMLNSKSRNGQEMIHWKRYASGLHEPLSIENVDGKLVVFSRNGLIRLHDYNNDMEADFYENLSNQFSQTIETREYANSFEKLPHGKGFLVVKGGIQPHSQGIHNNNLLHISPDGNKASILATGLREGFVAAHPATGDAYTTDQQGNWVPTTPVQLVRPGDFLGYKMPDRKEGFPETSEPFCWIPHLSARSGTDIFWAPEGFGSLSGKMILVDYHRPGLLQVFYDGRNPKQPQGGSRLLPLEFDHPILKAFADRDNQQIFLAGMQIFGSVAPNIGGITRLVPLRKPSFQVTNAGTHEGGVLLTFDQPLDLTQTTRADFRLQAWNYKRTKKYGSGHFKPDGTAGQEILPISGIQVSPGHKQLYIEIPKMQPAHTLEVGFSLFSQSGKTLEDKVWLTAHSLPKFDPTDSNFIPIPLKSASEATKSGPSQPTASQGKILYTTLGCIACHSLDGTEGKRPGPSFHGLPGKGRKLANGQTVRADKAYLRESILQPDMKTLDGYQDAEVKMPPYQGILTGHQVDSLVLFLLEQ